MTREAEPTAQALDVIAHLRAAGREFAVAAGTAIVRRGDPGSAFYAILAGAAEVRLTGEDGRTLPLRSLAAGEFFGEMSVLTGDPVSADVVATEPAALLEYPGHLLPGAMAECAPLRDLITRSLASNLRSSSTDVWNFFQRAETLNVLLDAGGKPGPLVHESKPMRKVAEEIRRHASTRDPVLVTGGPGTGKYYVALRIHEAAGDAAGRIIAVDCRRLAGEEGAKILFGSSRAAEGEAEPADPGSLQHYGAIHLANRGTLLLRHVEALGEAAQEALLRYLKRRAAAYPDARILATAGDSLPTLAAAGRFHPGLAALLGAEVLRLPTLWERRKDILPLAQVFLGEGKGAKALRIQEAAEHVLISRRYAHRNAAELREAVDLAALFAKGGEIQAEHIFTGPKEEGTPLEFDLAQVPLVGWLLRDRTLRGARGAVFVVFAAVVAVTLVRPDSAPGRFLNGAVWGAWWPSLMLAFLLLGRVWCTVCPLSSAAQVARRLARLDLTPPGWLKSCSWWLIPAGFLAIVGYEHGFRTAERPAATGALLLGLMGAAVAFSLLFQRETWCRYLCPMGNLGAVYSLSATLGVRSNPAVCGTLCTSHECHNGSSDRAGCPVFHHPLFARDSQVCKLCFTCLKSCPHGSAKLYLRPPLLRIWRQGELGGTLGLFALVVFFLSPVLLAAHGAGGWADSTVGFGVCVALAVALALALHQGLPRLLTGSSEPDSVLGLRVAFTLLVLGWGPGMAFHLGNSALVDSLAIQALPGSVWHGLLRGGAIPVLAVLQCIAIAAAACLAGVALFNIRRRAAEQNLAVPWAAWGSLGALVVLYAAASFAIAIAG